jgi:hypothetical protein
VVHIQSLVPSQVLRRRLMDNTGVAGRCAAGETEYSATLEFKGHGGREAFSQAVLRAVDSPSRRRAAHRGQPRVVPGQSQAKTRAVSGSPTTSEQPRH